MKSLHNTLLLIFVAFGQLAMAQTDRYQVAMKNALAMLDSAKTSEQYVAVANQFERIAAVETKQWLPLYYAAYSDLLAGVTVKENSQKDLLFERALALAGKADALSPDNSEIWTVKGYAQFMTMSVNPMSRMDLMQKSAASLEKAKALDPGNPRPWLVQAQNTFYTPEAFGGGKTPAKPLLEKAAARFETFKAEALLPDWGEARCGWLLEQCK